MIMLPKYVVCRYEMKKNNTNEYFYNSFFLIYNSFEDTVFQWQIFHADLSLKMIPTKSINHLKIFRLQDQQYKVRKYILYL